LLSISALASKLQSARIRTITSKTVYETTNPGGFSFDKFITLNGHFRQYFPIGKKLTFALGGDFLFITKSDSAAARDNFFLLGGPESISKRSVSLMGFNANEIPVRKMAGIRVSLDYKAAEKIHFNLISDLFAAQEVNRNDGFSYISGYGLEAGYESIIGPLKIGVMHGNYDRGTFFRKTKAYISIGYKF